MLNGREREALAHLEHQLVVEDAQSAGSSERRDG
jgi:hypothetical protein